MATVKTKIGTEESARKLRVEPTGGITATNTQKALEGLDTAKITATGALTTHAMLVATGAASAGTLGLLTDGQLMVGQTGADPLPKTLTGALSLTAAAVVAFTASAFANPTASIGLAAVNGTALTAMRSDAAPALSQTIAPTWTGNHTFSPTTGTAIAINPAANTYNRAITSTQTGPTSGSTAGPIAYNLIQGTNSAAVTGSGVGQDGLNNSNNILLKVRYVLGGTNWQGQASAAGQFTASVSNGAGNASSPDAVGIGGSAYINVSNPSATAGIFGVVPFVYVDNGGSISQAVGSEIDVWVATGGVATQRIGQRIRAQGNLQSSGGLDAAIVVDNFGVAGSAWKSLITISKNGSGIIPLDTTASLFTNDAAMTVAHVLNMPTVAVTGNILSFANLTVTGAGVASFGGGSAASSPQVLAASIASGGIASLTSMANTTAGFNGFDALTSNSGNGVSLLADEPNRTTVRFGQTIGNWAELLASGASNNGLIIGTITNKPVIIGVNSAAVAAFNAGQLIVGASSSNFSSTCVIHAGVDQNFNTAVKVNLADGVSFASVNDANTILKSIEFLAAQIYLNASSGVSVGTTTAPGAGKITVNSAYNVGSNQVVGARITGYTAMTGSPDKATAYATGSVTLPQLAGRVAQLQADLTTHGLIGA